LIKKDNYNKTKKEGLFFTQKVFMKKLSCIAAILLIIGGLNWGLVGFFDFNFVDMIFGMESVASRVVYAIVGLCAIYQIFQWKHVRKCWNKK